MKACLGDAGDNSLLWVFFLSTYILGAQTPGRLEYRDDPIVFCYTKRLKKGEGPDYRQQHTSDDAAITTVTRP